MVWKFDSVPSSLRKAQFLRLPNGFGLQAVKMCTPDNCALHLQTSLLCIKTALCLSLGINGFCVSSWSNSGGGQYNI